MKNTKLAVYLTLLYLTSIFCLYDAYISYPILHDINLPGIVFFIVLSTVAESSMVRLKHFGVSSGFAITVAAFIVFGPFWAMVIIGCGFIFRVIKYDGGYHHILNTPLYKTIFNVANITISIYSAAKAYSIPFNNLSDSVATLLRFVLFTLIFLLVNTLIISMLISILSRDRLSKSYYNNVKFGVLNIVAMVPFGAILAYMYQDYNVIGIIVVMVPIILVRYTYMLYIEAKSKYMQTVQALMHAMEARDKYTDGHSKRVANIAAMIARELRYSESRIEQLTIASLIHDIGKIGIDDNILNKPGKLDKEEYDIIKQHPEIGYDIVKDIAGFGDIPFLVRHHHERYDGGGYPSGKKWPEIGFDVFIIQMADCIDAMESDRPYRKGMTCDEIIDEIKRNSGTQFHPDVADAYIRALKKQNKRIW